MKIVTSGQMREIEARSERAGVSTDSLMERAGLEVARRVRHHIGHVTGVPMLVLVGPGNNGGDGLVAARHLDGWGARVTVYICLQGRRPDPKLDALSDKRAVVIEASEDEGLETLASTLTSAHLVVDAVLGTGRARPIEGLLKDVFGELAKAKATRDDLRILALDLPTGLDADTGAVDPASLSADVTVSLGYPKIGMFAFPGADRVGDLEVVDIGLPAGVDDDVDLELMTPAWASKTLPQRPSGAHKGTFGRTLVVAGSRNYIGAAYLAASAAYRVGAGLVTVAIPESLQAAVAAKAPEPTYLPLPESSPGVVSPEATSILLDSVGRYEALLVGCGLGQAASTREMVERLLYSDAPMPPMVVDADGLNILSLAPGEGQAWWQRFSSRAVLTPHPGEMARLTGVSLDKLRREDRVATATSSAAKWNKVTVLKGAYTVVASHGAGAMVSPFANPGLSTAGSGDVLAGAIAGLLSQGLTLEDAGALGVYLHGAAGDRVRERLADTGMIASDLLPALPIAIKQLRG